MASMLHVLHGFAATAATYLVASIWQGLAVAGCVAVVLRLLPGLTAAVRSAIWTAVLLLVILFPGLSFALHGNNLPTTAHAGLWHASARWSLALLGVWVAFSALRVGQLLGSAIRLRSLARCAETVTPSQPIAALLRASRRPVELCVSAEVHRPSVAGFFRSRILLSPETLGRLSAPELEHVILHELEHLRRYDDWTNLLQKLSLALLPLHPVLAWLDRRMCLERELACDDSVLLRTRAGKAYAACLVRLAEDSIIRRGFSLALGALGSRERSSELSDRVHRILRGPGKRMSRARACTATAVLLAGIFAAAAALSRTPELVSFVPATQPLSSVRAISASRFDMAAYRPLAARPVAVKAVMRQRRERAIQPRAVQIVSMQPAAAHRSTHRVRLASYTMPRAVAVPQPYFAAVAWQQALRSGSPALSVRPTRPMIEDPQFLYAAVPMSDGWLIIQL